MFAYGVADIDAGGFHGAGNQVFDEGDTAAAAGSGFGAFLNPLDRLDAFFRDGGADGGFCYRFAAADEGFVGEVHDAGTFRRAIPASEDQVFGVVGEHEAVVDGLQQYIIGGGIAYQDPAEQVFAVAADIDALIDAFLPVVENDAAAIGFGGKG